MNVLVLGVGGNVSQGILKALALSTLPKRVIGACISGNAAGLYTVDKAYISPAAVDPEFIAWLFDVCHKERIDVVLSGVEPVLTTIATVAGKLRDETNTVCIVSRPECLAIGDDKLTTCRWLEAQGFNFPRYADATSSSEVDALVKTYGFPLLAKPRRGKGAEGVVEFHNGRMLESVRGRAGYVLQEYLGSPDDEFTAGTFSDCDYAVRGTIVMRRQLLHGTTVRAEVGDFAEIRYEAIQIAQALKPMGPCNMQFRMHKGRPVCFEINTRFSGTTPIRARFGFNDVDASLRHFVLGEAMDEIQAVTNGVCLRYWNEVYVPLESVQSLERTRSLEYDRKHHAIVEDYGFAR